VSIKPRTCASLLTKFNLYITYIKDYKIKNVNENLTLMREYLHFRNIQNKLLQGQLDVEVIFEAAVGQASYLQDSR